MADPFLRTALEASIKLMRFHTRLMAYVQQVRSYLKMDLIFVFFSFLAKASENRKPAKLKTDSSCFFFFNITVYKLGGIIHNKKRSLSMEICRTRQKTESFSRV